MTEEANAVLRVENLSAGYHGGTVLHGVSLSVTEGGVHAVVGHNGAGKTTLLGTVAGLVPASGGRIFLDGKDITRTATHRRARAGIGYVPQGRRVFASVTVNEHLAVADRGRRGDPSAWTRARVLEMFPQLAQRLSHRGAQLSGGEQQMLAVARALLTQPRVLLLDEPTEGLAPAIVSQIRDVIVKLADDGMSILLAAPQPEMPIAVADHISVLTTGRPTASIRGEDARSDAASLLAALSTVGANPDVSPEDSAKAIADFDPTGDPK